MLRYKAILWQVIGTLITEPLTEDKPELTSQEIADLLKGLEERNGLAKIEGKVYSVKTLELLSPCGDEGKSRRWGSIIAHTKEKYCRGRKELENEIAAAYQISPPAQEKTKEPEQRELEAHPEKKPVAPDVIGNNQTHLENWDSALLPRTVWFHPVTDEELEGNYDDFLRFYQEIRNSGLLQNDSVKRYMRRQLEDISTYTVQKGFETPPPIILDDGSLDVDKTQQRGFTSIFPLTNGLADQDYTEFFQLYEEARDDGSLEDKEVRAWFDSTLVFLRKQMTEQSRKVPPPRKERPPFIALVDTNIVDVDKSQQPPPDPDLIGADRIDRYENLDDF